MTEPAFLTTDEVLAIHASRILRYGGAPRIRDLGLLESALAAPRATFGGEYLHGTVHEMAAAHLYHVVQNHPFVDGNKRVGLAAALAFLALNDVWLRAPDDDLVEMVLGVASGKISKSEVAVFILRNARPY